MKLEIVDRRRQEFAKVCEKVMALRQKGIFRVNDIATSCNIKVGTVQAAIYSLIKTGKIPKMTRGCVVMGENQFKEVVEQVRLLTLEGIRNPAQIADKIGVVVRHVHKARRLLIAQKMVQKMSGVNPSAFWRNLADEKTQLIISMVNNQNATLEQIGFALGGLSREYVRQVIDAITTLYGEKIFTPSHGFYTIAEASDLVGGISVEAIRDLCRDGKISSKRRSTARRAKFLLDEEGIEALRQHIMFRLKEVETACVVCGKVFLWCLEDSSSVAPILCGSKKCRQERRSQTMKVLCACLPTLESLHEEWQRQVFMRLKEHELPEDDRWVPVDQAFQLAGVSIAQLYHLRRRRVVATMDHPTQKANKTGRLVKLYSASQMAIIKEAYEACQENGKAS